MKANKVHETHMSVNYLDCCIKQKGGAFSSREFKNKLGVQYKVAFFVLVGKIKTNGPYLCREWKDMKFFWDGLIHHLDSMKKVETDDIYALDAPYKCKCHLMCWYDIGDG